MGNSDKSRSFAERMYFMLLAMPVFGCGALLLAEGPPEPAAKVFGISAVVFGLIVFVGAALFPREEI